MIKLKLYFENAGKPLSQDILEQIEKELLDKQIKIWREEKERARLRLLHDIARDLINCDADLSSLTPTILEILQKWNLDIDSIIRDIATSKSA